MVADKSTQVQNAINNLPEVELVQANYLNVFKVMNADQIVVTTDGLKAIAEWFTADKPDNSTKEATSA